MRVRYDAAAAEEFRLAVEYYEGKALGLGDDFEAEVKRVIRLILELPEAWRLLEDGTRRVLLRRFPYAVHYIPEGDELYVVAVADLRRKPGYWSDRLGH